MNTIDNNNGGIISMYDEFAETAASPEELLLQAEERTAHDATEARLEALRRAAGIIEAETENKSPLLRLMEKSWASTPTATVMLIGTAAEAEYATEWGKTKSTAAALRRLSYTPTALPALARGCMACSALGYSGLTQLLNAVSCAVFKTVASRLSRRKVSEDTARADVADVVDALNGIHNVAAVWLNDREREMGIPLTDTTLWEPALAWNVSADGSVFTPICGFSDALAHREAAASTRKKDRARAYASIADQA